VFTLTGTTPPDYVMIQIMTISGRIVREIQSAEIGPLNIGRNFTEYWWDGRDQFGDPLANGIYLYRVIVKDRGEDLELRSTDAAQYFKKGFGKMYLLR
jgi:flagellar hook assembly protein FlgD